MQHSTDRGDDYCVTHRAWLIMLNIMLKARCRRTTVSVYWSVLSVQSIIPECVTLCKMSGEHYLPNRVTACEPVTEISASVKIPDFRSQVI